LHQSYEDEKRFREDAIARLQEEQATIQSRLDKLYETIDLIDLLNRITFERKAPKWRQTQRRLANQITEQQTMPTIVSGSFALTSKSIERIVLVSRVTPQENRYSNRDFQQSLP